MEEGEAEARGKPRQGRLQRLSLVFAALALFFGLLALASQISGSRAASMNGFHYPARLPDGAEVVNAAAGSEVVKAVKKLHWEPQDVDVENAAMVHYSDGTILWLSVADNACSLLEAMAGKIAANERQLPYTSPVSLVVDGVKVYLVADKRTGLIHAFWCRGDMVAWAQLGIEPTNHDLIAEAIKELVDVTRYTP